MNKTQVNRTGWKEMIGLTMMQLGFPTAHKLTFLSSPPVTRTRPDLCPRARQLTFAPCATNSCSFQALLVFAPDMFADNFYLFFWKITNFLRFKYKAQQSLPHCFFHWIFVGTPADRLIDRFLLKIKASFN